MKIMRECECERVPKRTYINYILLLLEGGKERTTGTSEREKLSHTVGTKKPKRNKWVWKIYWTQNPKKITRELKKKQLVRKLITHSTIHNYLMPCWHYDCLSLSYTVVYFTRSIVIVLSFVRIVSHNWCDSVYWSDIL